MFGDPDVVLLQSIPSAVLGEGEEAGPSSAPANSNGVPNDLPPSYQSSAVGMCGQQGRREKT